MKVTLLTHNLKRVRYSLKDFQTLHRLTQDSFSGVSGEYKLGVLNRENVTYFCHCGHDFIRHGEKQFYASLIYDTYESVVKKLIANEIKRDSKS